MREQERAPRKYELLTIVHPEVDDETLPGELDRISGYITAAGGELIESLRESPWGRRRLAYPIRSGGKDVRDGYYTVWHFSIGPSRLDELERELKLNTQVIRYLVLSWEPKPLTEKEIEAAEIAAEEAAAAEYAAAQAAAAAAEAPEAETAVPVAEVEAPVAEAEDAARGLVADAGTAAELTAEAEAAEATGAELAIEPAADVEMAVEPVSAVEGRAEIQEEAAAALEKAAEAAEAETAEADADVPAGAVRGGEDGACPDDHPIKGNATSKLYHSPGSPSYNRTNAEFCFATVEAAEAAGYGPTKFEAAQEEGE